MIFIEQLDNGCAWVRHSYQFDPTNQPSDALQWHRPMPHMSVNMIHWAATVQVSMIPQILYYKDWVTQPAQSCGQAP